MSVSAHVEKGYEDPRVRAAGVEAAGAVRGGRYLSVFHSVPVTACSELTRLLLLAPVRTRQDLTRLDLGGCGG